MSTNDFRCAVTRNSISSFATLKKCVALAVIGVGLLSAAPCPTATFDVYIALGAAGCTITGITPPPGQVWSGGKVVPPGQ